MSWMTIITNNSNLYWICYFADAHLNMYIFFYGHTHDQTNSTVWRGARSCSSQIKKVGAHALLPHFIYIYQISLVEKFVKMEPQIRNSDYEPTWYSLTNIISVILWYKHKMLHNMKYTYHKFKKQWEGDKKDLEFPLFPSTSPPSFFPPILSTSKPM